MGADLEEALRGAEKEAQLFLKLLCNREPENEKCLKRTSKSFSVYY